MVEKDIFPCAGFFGGTDFDCLRIQTSTLICGIRLSLDQSEPISLNLKEIQFFTNGQRFIPLEQDCEFYQSSILKEQGLNMLLDGRGIHTLPERLPIWLVKFGKPFEIDEIRVFNRANEWARRSRKLTVEILADINAVWQKIYPLPLPLPLATSEHSSEIIKRTLISLNSSYLEQDWVVNSDDPSALRNQFIKAIVNIIKITQPNFDKINWREIIQVVDFWWLKKKISDDELFLVAAYLYAQKQRYTKTSIRLFSKALNTVEILNDLEAHINKIGDLYGHGKYLITRHGISRDVLNSQHVQFLSALNEVIVALQKLGYLSFICYGTLLGAVRSKKFVLHDDDVDLVYFINAKSFSTAATERLNLKECLEKVGFQVNLVQKYLNMHVKSITGKTIDIFPCWLENDKLQFHMDKMIIREVDKDIIFPLINIPLYDHYLPAPANPQAFLRARYGLDWHIENKYYEWPWDLFKSVKRIPRALKVLKKRPQTGVIEKIVINENNMKKSHIFLDNDCIPLTWWTHTPNFGDLLSPWLIQKITNRKVVLNIGKTNTYLAIGSVIDKATDNTVVWGSGAFGTESSAKLCKNSDYRAVRGPLTRNLLRTNKIDCPEVYGDPALLVPLYYHPNIQKTFEVGVVLRWSEVAWNRLNFGPGIKKIFLGSDNIEQVLDDILSCERILSSSLHGIIIADAYGIPCAWAASNTPKGLEFKYYDYFLSVNKIQKPQHFFPKSDEVSLVDLLTAFYFNTQKINFDSKALLDSCPFLPLNI